jgi:hypothetical protein
MSGIHTRNHVFRFGLGVAGGVLFWIAGTGWPQRDGNDGPPRLTVTRLPTRELRLTITNAGGSNSYDLLHRPAFDPDRPWQITGVGSNGQSNFVMSLGGERTRFFGARVSPDDDGDGVSNWMDANPTNAAIGALSVTITYPGNGATVP